MTGGFLAQVLTQDFVSLGQSAMSALFVLVLVASLLILVGWALGWWFTHRSGSVSVYGGGPLRRGNELSYSAVSHVETFLQGLDLEVNPPFDLGKAAVCAKTGRIFPDALTETEVAKVGWGFLRRYYRGSLVSWGSLSDQQQQRIRDLHGTLKGYQWEYSSLKERPQDIEWEFQLLKPGPLYVDPRTGILLGWRSVPGTDLELMVMQKPREKH